MDYVVFGQVITDDICFPGQPPMPGKLGGAVYTASGIRCWSDSVGMCSGVGEDFAAMHERWFDANGIDRRGCVVRALRSCHSLINYFDDGEREEIPMAGCATIDEMCPVIGDMPKDYRECRGFYFFKDCEEACWEPVTAYLKEYDPVSVWEIHGAAAYAGNLRNVARLLPRVTIFSLNMTEARRLLGAVDGDGGVGAAVGGVGGDQNAAVENAGCVAGADRNAAAESGMFAGKAEALAIQGAGMVRRLLELGARNVLLRMSEYGAVAGNASGIWHIPAVFTHVVDVTGGGNSSTGGFLAGFCESGGDVEMAGRCAAASASFIIEQFGQPERMDAQLMAEARRRAMALQTTRLA